MSARVGKRIGTRIGRRIGSPSDTGAVTPPPFTPSSLTGLIAWFRADTGITTVSGNVSQWLDQSSTAAICNQTNSAFRPEYLTTDPTDGLPSVSFDIASTETMRYPDNTPVYGGNTFTKSLWIYQPSGLADNTYIYWSQHGGSSATSRFQVGYIKSASAPIHNLQWLLYASGGNYTSNHDFSTRLDKWTHVMLTWEMSASAGNRVFVYFNNVANTPVSTSGVQPGTALNTTSTDLRISGRLSGGAPCTAKLDGLIEYNRVLTSTERGQIYAYRARSPT